MKNMHIEYIKEFLVLAKVKNYWEASEQLYISQSTLSKHIQILEKSLGIKLFERTTRSVCLTEYGIAFIPYAKEISKSYRSSLEILNQLKYKNEKKLTIGTIPSMLQYGITQSIFMFQKKFPDIKINVIEADANELLTLLKSKKCDLIYNRTFKDKKDNEIEYLPYTSDQMIAYIPLSHPFAIKDNIYWKDLKAEPICILKEGSFLHNCVIDACTQAGFYPKIAFSSHRIDAIIDMTKKHNCMALLMNKQVPVNDEEMVTLPIIPVLQSEICLCYLKHTELSDAAMKYINT